jgi:hypothetical protein
MFVTNHVLTGVSIGQGLQRRPGLAFVAGLGSHLLLDATPHWGCDPSAPDAQERFIRAAKRDGLLGVATTLIGIAISSERSRASTIAAICGAVLLDLDKPLMYFFGWNPFPGAVRRIHSRVQNETPQGMPNEVGFGLLCATADGLVVLLNHRHGQC